jgi:flagellar biosynthetic protein FliQ
MGIDEALELGRETLMLGLMVVGPMLVVGLIVGVTISLLQAVTQIQDQTLSFVPKIIAMALALAAFLPWMVTRLTEFTARMLSGG